MRTLSLVAVAWSFVGMPVLCRAGILVECCTSGVPAHEKSLGAQDGCPSKCPNKCPDNNREKCPDDPESSEPRDCDSCAETCNVVSPHSKQADRDHFAVTLVAASAAAQALAEQCPPHPYCSRDMSAEQFHEHMPYPVSDRPLLI